MKYKDLKGKLVEVRTKMNGLEVIGFLQEADETLVLNPAIPAHAFDGNGYGSYNAINIFKRYIVLGKTSIVSLDSVCSSVTESLAYGSIYKKIMEDINKKKGKTSSEILRTYP